MKTPLLTSVLILMCASLFAQRISFSSNGYSPESNDTIPEFRHSEFQFSFITPPLSTNGMDFHRTVNDVSLNTFIGISAGTEAMELAGFANVNLYYTQGMQLAGFANVSGLQSSLYQSGGIQAAGFGNINGNAYSGVQLAGFSNLSQKATGVQLAGFGNVNYQSTDVVQVAGFMNATAKGSELVQVAGFANGTLGGEANIQVAGFGNVAHDVDGVQAAGFMNVAKNVKGIQLSGFINVCDSLDGIAVGFINLVKSNGYRAYEFALNDWAPIQFNYKMGNENLYNIYSLSKLASNWNAYAVGFGMGHIFPLAPKTALALELIGHHAFSFDFPRNYSYYGINGYGPMFQLKPIIQRYINENTSLSFGPTLNFNPGNYRYYMRQGDFPNTHDTNLNIQPFWNLFSSGAPSRAWVGFTASVSIH